MPSTLKAYDLGLVTLWNTLLPVTLIDDAQHLWKLRGSPALLPGQAISSCLIIKELDAQLAGFRRDASKR